MKLMFAENELQAEDLPSQVREPAPEQGMIDLRFSKDRQERLPPGFVRAQDVLASASMQGRLFNIHCTARQARRSGTCGRGAC